jgi:ABC-2 type transport system permease protein
MLLLLTNELHKARTIRSPWLLLAAAQLVVLIGAAGRLSNTDGRPDAALAVGSVAHVGLASLFPLVLGILAVAGEFRHQTITDTFLGTPRRGRVIVAKFLGYGLLGLGFGLVTALFAVLVTAVGMALGDHSLDWSNAELWRTLGGGVGWHVLFAMLGVGIGALIRNVTAAIAAALAWLALVEGLVAQLIGDDASRWLPFAAGGALGRLPGGLGGGLSQWAGGVLLAGYALAFAVAAVVSTARRDVG